MDMTTALTQLDHDIESMKKVLRSVKKRKYERTTQVTQTLVITLSNISRDQPASDIFTARNSAFTQYFSDLTNGALIVEE